MTIRTRTGLMSAVAACVAIAACSGGGPTSPSSDPAAGGSSGAIIEGTVTGGGGQSAGMKATESSATSEPGLRPTANSPMAGVSVRVVGTNLAATVNDAGMFLLSGVPAGRVRLQFTGGNVNATTEIGNVSTEQFIQIQVQLSGTTAVVVAEERDGKVSLCHAEGNGSYHSITVSQSAEGAHRDHGDAKVGEPVPGRTNMTFNEQCEPVGPAVEIVKSTNGEDANDAPGPEILVGAAVTWSYLVTNTGTFTLSSITVTDDKGVVVTCPQTTLVGGAAMTCTGAGVAVQGQYANLGSVTASWTSPTASGTVSDSDPSHYLGVVPVEEEDGPKVTLCHRTGAGFFVKIEVSINAEPAHLAHGDGRPGAAVPNQPGRVFTATCGVQ